jgi:hypothetical protein
MSKKDEYIRDGRGQIYKVMPTYFLKMSPWEDGEDRRVNIIENDEYEVITYQNACMIVNKQFDDKVERWRFHGQNYIANSIGSNKNIEEYSYLISTLPSHQISIPSKDGNMELKLIRHKGKMYYILIVDEYLPRVQAFNLFGEFCQWIGIDHVKPIFSLDDKKYI